MLSDAVTICDRISSGGVATNCDNPPSGRSDALLTGIRYWGVIENRGHHLKESRDLFIVPIKPVSYGSFEIVEDSCDLPM